MSQKKRKNKSLLPISFAETGVPMTPELTQTTSPTSVNQYMKTFFKLPKNLKLHHNKKCSLLLLNLKLTSPIKKKPVERNNKFAYSSKLNRYLFKKGINKELTDSMIKPISISLTKIPKNNIVNCPIKIKPKQKYPLIHETSAFPLASLYPTSKKLFQYNYQSKSLTQSETEKIFSRGFSLINKNKFSPQFQRIFENHPNLIMDDLDAITKSLKKNISVSNKANEKVKIIHKDEDAKHKYLLLHRMKTLIIRAAIDFKRLNISIDEFYQKYNVNIPFSNKDTESLLFAIKNKDSTLLNELLSENKFLVLDFDYVTHKYNIYYLV